ncbi:hypothetical protein KSS87_005495 [Heliosperma pusillum]|nr:hypothetical protein KSS87_005495 [Heliosperma pusillum]
MGVRQAIKKLDAFPRAEDHLLQKTQSGAIVLSVDAIDMSGKHEVDLDTNIWKAYTSASVLKTGTYHVNIQLRLNSDGYIIGTEFLTDLVEKGSSHDHGHHNHHQSGHKDVHVDHKDEHGDDKEKEEDLKQKSHLQGFDEETEKMVKKVKQAMANGEGCRVYGVLDVQRVAGNFHISVHGLNIFVAQMIFEGSNHVNVSHMIHDLSFGPKYPGIHNPLDDTVRILRGASGTFKYYIKIVPTEYKYISKDVLPTNQFSVTEYFSPMKEFDRSWPAVYFLYDLSPITVTIREERRSFLHFLTRLSAVLGGTFALTGMLDRWMYRLVEAVTKPNKRGAL